MPSDNQASRFSGSDVLITGGLGFIGSHVARRLVNADARVTVVDSLIPEYGGNPRNVADIADRLTVNIRDVRDPHSIRALPLARLVNPPLDENHTLRLVDFKGINKVADLGLHVIHQPVYANPTSAIRLTGRYGRNMRVRGALKAHLNVWLRRALTAVRTPVLAHGRQQLDSTYVDDVVDPLLLAVTDPKAGGRIFPLVNGEVPRRGAFAELICGLAPDSHSSLRPTLDDRRRIDISDFLVERSLLAAELLRHATTSLWADLSRALHHCRVDRPENWGTA